jgi:glycerophosphoryl diester phosphodiesterase
VARHAARLWQGQGTPPLLSSFDVESLQGAQAATPDLPRALLIDQLHDRPWDDCLQQALSLQCQALVCNHLLWNAHTCSQAAAVGLHALSYTVNTEEEALRLQALGVVGIITDRVNWLGPGAALRCASP